MTWLRIFFMTVQPSWRTFAHERLITLCNVDADIGILTGIYAPVNVAL